MATISVIIPVYNGQKTIEETINTVLQQSFTDLELIVINAGSTDATLFVVSQIQDPRLKVFSYDKANVAVNRNRGFKHATGMFCSFLDADDLWTPDKLEAQYRVLIDNPEAGVAYSWTNCIDETGKFLRSCSTSKWTGDVYPKLLLDDFIGSGSNVLILRETFTAVSGFDELLSNAQDTDMWLRLAALYHFVVVPKVQILYRISTNSMSSNILGLEKSNLHGNFLKAGRHITATGSVYSQLLLSNLLENGSNPLIRKEALKEVGGFDESLTAAEDWDMWLRLSERYEFVCVERVQILYRVSTNSMSTNFTRQEVESLKVIERAFSQPQAESLQHLKKYSKAQLYKYLMFKAIEAPLNRQKSCTAALFLWKCVKYDLSVLQQKRVMLIVVLKIVFPQLYQRLNQFLYSKQRTSNNSVIG